jgi:hypothetical protein
MLCVKEPRDIARAITTIIENNATDRTFLELRLGNLQSVINLPFFDQVCVSPKIPHSKYVTLCPHILIMSHVTQLLPRRMQQRQRHFPRPRPATHPARQSFRSRVRARHVLR